MKFNLNWLKQYIDIDLEPPDIAEKLTMAGVEVGECTPLGAGFENVVTAEILKIRKHPNADKLSVCQVSNGKTILSVVCGASNIKEKDKVPFAMEGAVLPGGFKIKKSKIRGETSFGMLCSAKELQIGEDAEGIYILSKDAPLGRNLSEYLNLKDWKFELEIMPNRGDLLGMIGIAREVGALTGRRVKLPELPEDAGQRSGSAGDVSVEIMDSDLCPRYTAAVVKGIKVGESPDWLKRCLEGAGIRPVNNIVDITNYVMMEWGQPLHAFDLSLIRGRKIVVRRARKGERIKTLDGVQRELDPADLTISDFSRPVAIGGVMGGEESEIKSNTRDILLESAYFDPRTIRKTRTRLGLSSESSYRFERGVDPEGLRKALLRALSLAENLAGGKLERNVIDVYPKEFKGTKIILRSDKVKEILGVQIPPRKIKGILEGLEMSVKNYGDVDFEVTVPLFRGDITRDVDLVEEVARIYGYHLIPSTLPQDLPPPDFKKAGAEALRELEELLVGAGFSQVKNYSFVSPRENSCFVGSEPEIEGRALRLQNPISEDLSVMRQSILPSLLKNVAYHRARNMENLKIYEIDKTFHVFGHHCREKKCLALAVTGEDFADRWDCRSRKYDFFDVKGISEEIAQRFGLKDLVYRPASKKYLHPGLSAEVLCEEKPLGFLGLVHPDILGKYELDELYVLEMDLDIFVSVMRETATYSTFSKYPAVLRDISLVVDEHVTHEEILSSIEKRRGQLVKDIQLFDYYKGGQVPGNKKSLSYRIVYQSFERTLTDEEVLEVHQNIVKGLSLDVKAELRK